LLGGLSPDMLGGVNSDSILSRAGGDNPSGGLSPPLDRSTTFEGAAGRASAYGRAHSPTLQGVEGTLGALEDATALAFASGMTAWSVLCQTVLRPGDVVAIPTRGYYGVEFHAQLLLEPWGIEVRRFDPVDSGALPDAARGATIVLVETPANPDMRVVDIAGHARVARAAGALVVCDNTVATPLLQRPLDLGADITWQSATKYLGGHSDVLAGVLATRDPALVSKLLEVRTCVGGALSPDAAWLLARGLRTLSVRVARQCETALDLAQRLEKHAAVKQVNYPGLADHPDRATCDRQMSGGFGGLLSFEVADAALADRLIASLTLICGATSLGGVESLIERRGRIEPEGRVPAGLLRLSVGLEDVDDLWADLRAGLDLLPR
jgi:cystathionine gamma-synthase